MTWQDAVSAAATETGAQWRELSSEVCPEREGAAHPHHDRPVNTLIASVAPLETRHARLHGVDPSVWRRSGD